MGWGSAGDIFDPIAQALIDAEVSASVKFTVLKDLIRRLQQEDWDTENASLDKFRDDPWVVAAFNANGVS